MCQIKYIAIYDKLDCIGLDKVVCTFIDINQISFYVSEACIFLTFYLIKHKFMGMKTCDTTSHKPKKLHATLTNVYGVINDKSEIIYVDVTLETEAPKGIKNQQLFQVSILYMNVHL